jgi:hypothetical protein
LWNSDLCWITCNNGCSMWLVMLNHYDLGLYVGWFEIPRCTFVLIIWAFCDRAYLHHIFCYVKNRTTRRYKSYTLIETCKCVEFFITFLIINIVGTPWIMNLSFEWMPFGKYGLSLFLSFLFSFSLFLGGQLSTHCFIYLDTCPFFLSCPLAWIFSSFF